MDLKFFFSLFVRRLPYLIFFGVTGTALGFAVAMMLPPVYVAEARLLVESEQIPGNLAASTVQTQATEQLQIIQSRITTRANLLDMANRLNVYQGQPSRPADEIVADMRARTRIASVGGPTRRGESAATILRVAFEAPSGVIAATVANELVTLILQENVALRTAVSGQTLDFFRQQVTRLDQDLSESRRRILEFQQGNLDSMPNSLDFRRTQQVAAQERLLQLEREHASLNERRELLVALFDRTGRVDIAANPLTPEERQLQAARDSLSAALSVYSPAHPQVTILENRVAYLERQVATSTGASLDGEDGAFSVFDLQIADIDGQIASLDDRRQIIEAELAQLQRSIEATPGNAIQLEALERDYANLRIQYDQTVANRARAETGDLIEALSKGERITVVEQAVVPRQPSRPNRPLVAGAGVGVGFAFGFMLIVLLELLNRAIRRPVELTQQLGITPFAVLPYIRTQREARRRSMIIAGSLAVVIIGVPGLIWAVDTFYMPIDLLINAVINRLGLTSLIDQIRQFGGA